MQSFNKSIVPVVICLLRLKAVYGIGGESFVICEIYGFNDSSAPVRSVAQKIYEVVYFAITCKFYRDFFSLFVFAVNLVNGTTCELI